MNDKTDSDSKIAGRAGDAAWGNCRVVEGRIVEPCKALSEAVDNIAPGFSKAKGIARWRYTNLETRKVSRIFFGIKSTTYPDGMSFNFCPWCGTQIDAPFVTDEEPAQVPA